MAEQDTSIKYWCHTCHGETTPELKDDDFFCPTCGDEFVEAIEDDDDPRLFDSEVKEEEKKEPQNRPPHWLQQLFPNANIQVTVSNNGQQASYRSNMNNNFGPAQPMPFGAQGQQFHSMFDAMPQFNPLEAFRNPQHLQQLMQNMFPPGFINFGAPNQNNMRNILADLFFRDSNRYGTPPTSKSVVDNLDDHQYIPEISEQQAACSVCQDDFGDGDTLKQLPCKHYFHKDCLLPWLKEHSNCPDCRFQLKTDDPHFEELVRAREANRTSDNSSNNNVNSSNDANGSDTAQ